MTILIVPWLHLLHIIIWHGNYNLLQNANSILSYHVIEWIYQNIVYLSTQSRYSKILISIPPSTIVETVTGSITLPASSQKDTWSFKYFIQRALPILVTVSTESSFTPIPPNFLIRYFSLIFKSTIGVHNMQTNQKHEGTMHRKLRQKKKSYKGSMDGSESVLVFWRDSDKVFIRI